MPATVTPLTEHQPDPERITILIAPGDPAGYPITHPYVDTTGAPAIFERGEFAHGPAVMGHGQSSPETEVRADERELAIDGDQFGHCVILKPWVDPLVDRLGIGVRSPYVERVWLGVLGPSSTWALRRLGGLASENPAGVEIDLAAIAAELGLGRSMSPSSRLMRSIERLQRFGIARWSGDELFVRTYVDLVPCRLVGRLAVSARESHRLVADHLRHLGRR